MVLRALVDGKKKCVCVGGAPRRSILGSFRFCVPECSFHENRVLGYNKLTTNIGTIGIIHSHYTFVINVLGFRLGFEIRKSLSSVFLPH